MLCHKGPTFLSPLVCMLCHKGYTHSKHSIACVIRDTHTRHSICVTHDKGYTRVSWSVYPLSWIHTEGYTCVSFIVCDTYAVSHKCVYPREGYTLITYRVKQCRVCVCSHCVCLHCVCLHLSCVTLVVWHSVCVYPLSRVSRVCIHTHDTACVCILCRVCIHTHDTACVCIIYRVCLTHDTAYTQQETHTAPHTHLKETHTTQAQHRIRAQQGRVGFLVYFSFTRDTHT